MDNTMEIVFNDNNIINEPNFEDNKIIIFSERNGRKTNTYIVDWDIDKNEKKQHLKNLKKKYGCNGSIKIKKYQGDDKEVLHLQGEFKNEIKNYLLSNDIIEENIEIKV